ncbi:hypothetical protein ACHAW5_004318 [Stephanodiscus triporus]|uniref:Uncharacterized protein n=1 Tax=Stephanodiscus triporus TaxID=2934178 RepID=A0ABD3N037_9STRA
MTGNHRSNRRTHARENSVVSYDTYDTASTESSDESGLFEEIVSTMCCGGSFESYSGPSTNDSLIKRTKQATAIEAKSGNMFCQNVGKIFGIPPQFVLAHECHADDFSEITLPPALVKMVNEYDTENSRLVQSMMDESFSDLELNRRSESRSSKPTITLEPMNRPVRALKSLMTNRSGVSVGARSVDSKSSKRGKGSEPNGGFNKKPVNKHREELLTPTDLEDYSVRRSNLSKLSVQTGRVRINANRYAI